MDIVTFARLETTNSLSNQSQNRQRVFKTSPGPPGHLIDKFKDFLEI
jgi:hypothetical protein